MGILAALGTTLLVDCDQVLSRCEDHVPVLVGIPGRDRERGLRAIVFGLDEVLAGTRSGNGHGADADFWPGYFSDAGQRGVPLSVQQRVLDFCVTRVLRSAWARAADDDAVELMALTSFAEIHQRQVRRYAAESYHRLYANTGEHERARRLLADELLTGARSDDKRPWLVAVAPKGLPGPSDLPTTSRPEGSVLLALAEPSRVSAEETVRECLGAVTAGGCWAATAADIPAAFDEAVRAARAAAVVPSAASLLLPSDLILERHLLTDPTFATALSTPWAAIAPNPDLEATLRALITHNLDRTATAAALHINRRTLTHRLNRIATLTGYDPRTARGLQVLANALSAQGLRFDHPENR
ncbi:helix-turn-helix domain-containing protein [Amycolatopsis sp. NPDC004378]